MSRQTDYSAFRKMYTQFIYESYAYDVQPDGLHISFSFSISGAGSEPIHFEPTAFIPHRPFYSFTQAISPSSNQTINTLVFNIGMIELISYWKCYCPPTVVVRPYRLDESQVMFWKKLYFNGLGEFFYTNGIETTQDDFLNFSFEGKETFPKADVHFTPDEDPHIVPIGGGKDSVVTLELLSQLSTTQSINQSTTRSSFSVRPLPLIMNPRGATISCVEKAGYSLDDVIVIKRSIHPLLLELNSKGALNGHTPFSAMLAFYTLLASALTGSRPRIALSNENSANESTVPGLEVNHQYSKSIEFENDFRRYVKEYISPEFDYYSFLRPLSELQIAMLFARYEKYHSVFRSCNVGSKQDVWCGHCAKCLFAYIILSPFIEPERLDAIFGKNMLDDASLRHEFDQLRGVAESKPFECVGTVDEVNTALSMTLARWYPDTRPALLQGMVELCVPAKHMVALCVPAKQNTVALCVPAKHTVALCVPAKHMVELCVPAKQNNLPPNEYDIISQSINQSGIQVFKFFNLLAFKRILIAGYGREGQSSEKLLKMLFPRGKSYDIACNNEEIKAMLLENKYDLILKSPGIPTYFFDGLCSPEIISSQADLFLQVYGDCTIGITGTKGKSTTATLTHHILQQSLGSESRRFLLAGNIGIPLFDIIPQMDSCTTVVAELSCHQLENIHRAPHISLLLNLYQEHLDHYRSYEDYKLAKMQIALRQTPNDYFIYCSDSTEALCVPAKEDTEALCVPAKEDDLVNIVDKYRSELRQTVKAYSLEEAKHSFLSGAESPLPGDHNLSNIYAVYCVTSLLGVAQTQFLEALASFKGLEHRLEKVATIGSITYYNDSISTIPQTTIAAIEALKNVRALILGGFDRGIDYTPLVDYLETTEMGKQINCIVLFGSAGKRIHELLEAHHGSPLRPRKGNEIHGSPLRPRKELRSYMFHFESDYSMEEAVAFVAAHVNTQSTNPSGSQTICLLSPAASSYDHYKNFEERGRDFKRCVQSLISNVQGGPLRPRKGNN